MKIPTLRVALGAALLIGQSTIVGAQTPSPTPQAQPGVIAPTPPGTQPVPQSGVPTTTPSGAQVPAPQGGLQTPPFQPAATPPPIAPPSPAPVPTPPGVVPPPTGPTSPTPGSQPVGGIAGAATAPLTPQTSVLPAPAALPSDPEIDTAVVLLQRIQTLTGGAIQDSDRLDKATADKKADGNGMVKVDRATIDEIHALAGQIESMLPVKKQP